MKTRSVIGRKLRTILIRASLYASITILVLTLCVYFHYRSEIAMAKRDTPVLVSKALADADKRGATLLPEDLSARQKEILFAVEDPAFKSHHGVDFHTPGAGWTTITQGLAKLLYFPEGFKAGYRKIRQTLLAEYALDAMVPKNEQMKLYLSITYLGSEEGRAISGYADAARTYFDKPFSDLTEREFISLVAMTIAPNNLKPGTAANEERITRIQAYLDGNYTPTDLMDVTYDGKVPEYGISGKFLLGLLRLFTKDRPDEW